MEINTKSWIMDYYDENEIHFYRKKKTYFSGKTKFQKVEFVELPSIGETLIIDGELQSARQDEYIYHESLVHPACLLNQKTEHVLIIGGGEGATLREVLKYNTIKSVTMVDIDEELVQLFSRKMENWHKGSFKDPRVNLVFEDGRKYLEDTSERFDVIILDLTSSFGERVEEKFDPILNLYSKQFYSICSSKLKKDGLIGIQALELTPADWSEHAVIRRSLATAFKHVLSYSVFIPSFYTTWGFLLASQSHNFETLTSKKINDMIARKKISSKLSFFDGNTFIGTSNLSKDLRRNILQKGSIIEDNKPLVVYPKEPN
ncbi:putative spermidine synthase [Leptospira broomii serovar Hurstbridge str. 5399]|uniref:Polyamine aminopropyltransferase n=1 Tax=Leptospira broomii serovar Hurstbridge str. 5399 TaxID=1049789 RepID=T0G9Q5_9LEPT|nr:methyltransferase domain-containing protein [Leptospira broomii]EQA43539.1 putative spermidine synthase [Leptospira broomii serovar Hurstbridge str. 5399]